MRVLFAKRPLPINTPSPAQVRTLTKEMDAFSLAAKSGENPFETKSYDDGFQSANSFFSGGSRSQLDVADQSTSLTTSKTIAGISTSTATATTSTVASATISASASMPLYDGKSTSCSGYPAYRPKDGLAVVESTTDANLYELHGDGSPDSGLQTSLA